MFKFPYRLIHDANHYIGEDAELEEIAKLNAKIKGFQDVCLAQVKDQGNASIVKVMKRLRLLLEAVSKESW